MSILIKGVEKPKDCCHCRFLSKTKISSDCKFLTIDYYCDVLAKWKGKTDCPLIELPDIYIDMSKAFMQELTDKICIKEDNE